MSKKWQLIDFIKWGEQYFSEREFENPKGEIEWFLCSLLKCNRLDIYLRYDESISRKNRKILRSWIKRRLNREPLQYITGVCEFYGREFYVNSNVLIPRPETERLIDIAIEKHKKINNKPSILDIGSGSGCIAITIALEIPQSFVLGIDCSPNANITAKQNSSKLNAKNVSFLDMDIFKKFPNDNFDIVISNPPYIPKNEFNSLMKDVKGFEPEIALTDNKDGLIFYQRYADLSKNLIKKNGLLILEVGRDNHPFEVENIFKERGHNNICTYEDFNGDTRVIAIQF